MRRTLLYVPHELFEIVQFQIGPFPFYIGWLLIAWVIFCVGLLAYLTWAQGWNRDTQSYLPMMAIIALALGAAVPWLEIRDPNGDPVGLPVRGYGLMVMLGAILGVGLAIYRARRMGLHHDVILSLSFWMFVCGISGARLFYVIQKWPDMRVLTEAGQLDVVKTLAACFSFQSGGLVVYGSVIGGVGAAYFFLRSKKLPFLAVADLIAPSMLVGLWLGRIGCLMNGCCYGGLCEPDSPFHWTAISFPRDAEPYLHKSLPEIARENSPPYQRQRATGLLHGVKVERTPDGPRVAAVDPDRFADSPLGDEYHPQVGDPIRSFDVGTEQVDPATNSNVPSLFYDLSPRYKTDKDEVRSWSIDALPDYGLPTHPSQIYSSINAGLMALFLWFLFPSRQRDGQVFAVMLIVYPIARALLEAIRDDEYGQFGTTLTISQWFSVLVIAFGVGLLFYIFRQPKESHLTTAFAPTE